MKRTWIIIAVIALLVVVGWFLYRSNATRRAAEEATSEAERAALSEDLDNVIWASGKLEPITWAALGPVNSGIVSAIHVAEGDWVAAVAMFSGTFTEDADFFGTPLSHTGEPIAWVLGAVNRYDAEGKVVEQWVEGDATPLLQGLGLMPAFGE